MFWAASWGTEGVVLASGCVHLGSAFSPFGPKFVSAECSANTGLPISLAKGMAPSNFRGGRKARTVFLLHRLIGVSFGLHGMKVPHESQFSPHLIVRVTCCWKPASHCHAGGLTVVASPVTLHGMGIQVTASHLARFHGCQSLK